MSEQNNTQVIGADVKRLPFKDLVKRIGPGLIATGIVISAPAPLPPPPCWAPAMATA